MRGSGEVGGVGEEVGGWVGGGGQVRNCKDPIG